MYVEYITTMYGTNHYAVTTQLTNVVQYIRTASVAWRYCMASATRRNAKDVRYDVIIVLCTQRVLRAHGRARAAEARRFKPPPNFMSFSMRIDNRCVYGNTRFHYG